jgi:hypothetical protein
MEPRPFTELFRFWKWDTSTKVSFFFLALTFFNSLEMGPGALAQTDVPYNPYLVAGYEIGLPLIIAFAILIAQEWSAKKSLAKGWSSFPARAGLVLFSLMVYFIALMILGHSESGTLNRTVSNCLRPSMGDRTYETCNLWVNGDRTKGVPAYIYGLGKFKSLPDEFQDRIRKNLEAEASKRAAH